ncbi:MAG TPA: DNA internalization-related competence protein ComEC/Rec2, partial [Gemmatimonadaceae bacterium]|nr:DNA internalization-related competence protein ComEC/Rec2 [Gemmatimonadaceae bacterium]
MPLIAFAVIAYAAGLAAGFASAMPALAVASGAAVIVAVVAWRRGDVTRSAIALVFATGVMVASDAPAPMRDAGARAPSAEAPASALGRWRFRTGATIDTLFGDDAPVVRALLIADTRQLPPDVRDRFSRAGLVHILSISGLHVAIISGAMLLALQMVRIRRSLARWIAVGVTAAYVVAIGAPPPALRSGVMFAAQTAGWALQRPVSPWATLALGALVPLLADPRTVLDLGYQLSVAGFAAVTAGGVWARRTLPADLRGWRRALATDLCVSTIASFASAPLVAWHFARISLIAPLANLVAAPIVAVMQPALFLAMVLAPVGAPARLAADGAGLFVRALDAVADVASRVPGASLPVAPSLTAAVAGGGAVVCALAAAAARRSRARWGIAAVAGVALVAWQPLVPRPGAGMEIHMIDVGQGDAIAVRTPHRHWLVVDAGGGRVSGDVGRRVVVPYLRRLGGDVPLFVMTHPHDDHVGGGAALIGLLRPADVRDGAFAGTSPSYREALVAARDGHVGWHRVHPGDSVTVDGVVATFLAPDSAWTAALTDPNLASVVVRVRFGRVRALLTGDAEAPEEAWLLHTAPAALAADVLKVGHHGSATSSTPAFLDAVHPQVALVSVGAGNRYHHPSPAVMDTLAARGIAVARTDERGAIVVRTDAAGDAFEVIAAGTVIARGRARTG